MTIEKFVSAILPYQRLTRIIPMFVMRRAPTCSHIAQNVREPISLNFLRENDDILICSNGFTFFAKIYAITDENTAAARYPKPTNGSDGEKIVNVRTINPTCKQILVNSVMFRKSILLCAYNTTENEFAKVRIRTDMNMHKKRMNTSNATRSPILNIDGEIQATITATGSNRKITNATPNKDELNVTLADFASALCKSRVKYRDIELFIEVNNMVI